MGSTLSQLSQLWPPASRFTEKNAPNQEGKVFIVTGASAGVGRELARLLFGLNARVYLAGRSESRIKTTVEQIRSSLPQSKGDLRFLACELEDLASVRDAAKSFLRQESRLDVLVHNAGVMMPPEGSVTKQGHELQFGVHALAPLLLTKLLMPIMVGTAMSQTTGSVRVVWVASSAAELFSPPGGVDMDNIDYKKNNVAPNVKYGTSKAAMYLLANRYSKMDDIGGVVHIACNPGNIKTDLRRHLSWWMATIFGWISHDPVKGAYTELYCALSDDPADKSGAWVIPWGRLSSFRQDVQRSTKSKAEGGTGVGEELWKWCEMQLAKYMD